jgi:hypothetical protein
MAIERNPSPIPDFIRASSANARAGSIAAAIAALDDTTAELKDAVNVLMDLLAPVQMGIPSSPLHAEKTAESPVRCPMGLALFEYIGRLRLIAQQVRELTKRIDL